MKVGSKAKDCEVFSRDPVLKLCSASGSTPLRQSKFEGFGKRLGNFHLRSRALLMVQHHNKRQVLMTVQIREIQFRSAVQHRAASCNDNSICGNVDEASLFGFPEFVLNCEPDGSEHVATRPLSKMMGRHGVLADTGICICVETTVSSWGSFESVESVHLISLL